MGKMKITRGEYCFLFAAFASFVYSNALYNGWYHVVDHSGGIYVGHWVTSILGMLIYLRLLLTRKE